MNEILKKYDLKNVRNITPINSGIINSTYVITNIDDLGNEHKYLLQKINTNVFPEPYKLMNNIAKVTDYLKKKVKKEGENKKTLEVIKTKDGQSLCQITSSNDTREYYRIYEYIDNAISYNKSVDKEIVYNSGKAFGNFQKLLNDFPINTIEETIPDFHNTKKRFAKLIKDIQLDINNPLVNEVTKEIVFLLQRSNKASSIVDGLEKNEIPLRVTHNDTKVNNVLMNKDDNSYLAVIDLDTVMPGSLLYDYGDGIRSTCSTALEDEKDLSKVSIDIELFKSYTDGFMSEMAPYITEKELKLMGESIRILTYELAVRFLNDYINGSTYFKIDYPTHNLDRARNQIRLVEDIENKMDIIENYIEESYLSYNKSNAKTLKRI